MMMKKTKLTVTLSLMLVIGFLMIWYVSMECLLLVVLQQRLYVDMANARTGNSDLT